MSFLLVASLICFALRAFAAPFTPDLAPRDAATAAHPIINATATVLDHNGLDITSSFQLKIYHQPLPSKTTDNTTDNPLNPRQPTAFTRTINVCPPNETFLHSMCHPEPNVPSSLQRYSYTCRLQRPVGPATGPGAHLNYHLRTGHCRPTEICVNRYVPGTNVVDMATCVEMWVFEPATVGGSRSRLEAAMDLEGLSVYGVLSKGDQSTPIEAGEFDVEAWMDGVVVGGNEQGMEREASCRDCAEVETGVLGPGIGGLEVQAKLLAAGEVALGGILWLAVMSAG